MKKAIIISAIALLLVGGTYVGVQLVRLKLTKFEYNKSIIKVFGISRIALTSQFLIRNKSDFDITILHQDYYVYVNDIQVGRIGGDKQTQILLKKKQYVNVDVDIDFNPVVVLKAALYNIAEFIQDPSKILVTIKGSVTFSSMLISKDKFNVEYKTTMADLIV